jgi:hypothetical protein
VNRFDKYIIYFGTACFAALLYFASSNARGETLISRSGADYVRLFDTPCSSNEVLLGLDEEGRKAGVPPAAIADVLSRLRNGEAGLDGKVYKMCWLDFGPFYGLFYDDGDRGQVPTELFQPEAL